jgi:cystathionine beta-synthase
MFCGGAGTGGTISGVGRFLKEKTIHALKLFVRIQLVVFCMIFFIIKKYEPAKPYKVEGVGEDMLPDNVHLNVMMILSKSQIKNAFDYDPSN